MVHAAQEAGLQRIVIVVSSDVAAFAAVVGNSQEFAVQKDRLGTGHALQQAQKVLEGFRGETVILCGDAPLVRADTIRALMDCHRSNANVCTVLTAELSEPKDYGRIVRNRAGRVVGIVEEKMATAREKMIREVNSGAYCLKFPEASKALAGIEKRLGGTEYPLTDIVGSLAKAGARVGAFVAQDPEEITGINSRATLAVAEKIMQRRIASFHMDNGVSIVDPENTWIGCDVRIGQDTVIEPFSVIEGEVRIGAGCVVGPFAHLRDATVLEDGAEIGNFVEVKKSTIGSLSKAKHLSYLGDTMVGRKVNIGAGTITANYDGKNKHATTIEDGASIGSNTTLVAPVRVGAGAVTGAGSVILRRRDVKPGSVVAGVPARVIRNGGN